MREILFRGKPAGDVPARCLDEHGFVIGWYCPTPFSSWPLTPAIYPAELSNNGEWRPIEIKPLSLGQYTGLTDKNGKKIFEGDIISLKNPEPCRNTKAIVRYNQLSWVISFDRWGDYFLQNFMDDDIEVIGNIYDNPEMLEAKNG